ncbi:MAG TPA: redoxin family protein [Terriglobia bacterium]|nr:redoxin family protein [Terriglobia bacterium]
MKSVLVWLLATASIGWAPPSQTQAQSQGAAQAGDPAAVLSEASSVYRQASNLQIKGTKVREQHDEFVDEVARTPFELVLTPDNKFLQKAQGEAGDVLQICDGEQHWTYLPQTNRYSSAPGTPSPTSLFNTAIDLRYLTTGLLSAKRLRQETLEADGVQRFCDVIEAHYERPNQGSAEFGDVLFWIDTRSHLVWKTRTPVTVKIGAFGTEVSYTETTLYTDVRLSQDLPAGIFKFTPPPGAWEEGANAPDPRTLYVGHPAPDFTLRNLDGSQTQLSALRGQVVLLDFWATWCGPCRYTMPRLDNLSKKFKSQGVVIMGIDDNEDEQTVRDFIREHHFEYPILLSSRRDGVLDHYSVRGLPTMVLIDRNGVVADYKLGYGNETEDDLRADLARVSGAGYIPPRPAATSVTGEAGAPLDNWPEPKTPDDFLRRGYEHLRLHNYPLATADASSALKLKPDWTSALRLRAHAAYEARDYASAIKDCTAVLAEHPDWAEMYDARGLAQSASGRPDLAIPDYTEAVKYDPYLAEAYNDRGWAYFQTGNVALAIQDLNHALEIVPQYATAHENRAKAFDKQNDLQSELIDLEDLLRLAPANPWAKAQRADVLRRLSATSNSPPVAAQ